MPLPKSFEGRLSLPIVVAPMFLASGPKLVIEACRAGFVGTFPALNQRTTRGVEDWIASIEGALSDKDAPYGINLIVHRTNARLNEDLDAIVRHKVPLVISSMGAAPEVVEAVHSYGGTIFHDVITVRHARKAASVGVDGIVLVAAGAGGHGGTLNPFAFVDEVRRFFKGTLLLGGGISTGAQVAAARMTGADLAYMGTRFLATRETTVTEAQKEMMVQASADDVVYTQKVSGVHANFLRPTVQTAGIEEGGPSGPPKIDVEQENDPNARAWRDIWSAGQGVGAITDAPAIAELADRLKAEFAAASTDW